MNERIRELHKQAVAYALSVCDADGVYQGREYLQVIREKFAELIVQECAKIVEDSPWNLPRGYNSVDQAKLVKKHFGVK